MNGGSRFIARRKLRRGFSMIETVMSIVLVGGLFVTALNTAGTSAAARRTSLFRAEGMLVAQDLTAEILQQAYSEPSGGIVVLGISLTGLSGPDSGETSTDGSRKNFDDVDDYDGWSGTVQSKQGVAVSWATRYSVSVKVDSVVATAPATVSATETGVKRIKVTVTRGGATVTTLTSYRSAAWGGRIE